MIWWIITLSTYFHKDNGTVTMEDEDNQQMINQRNGNEQDDLRRSQRRQVEFLILQQKWLMRNFISTDRLYFYYEDYVVCWVYIYIFMFIFS